MIFRYFPETDMLYVELAGAVSMESEKFAPGMVRDYDESGHVIGIEFEYASTKSDLAHLELSSLRLVNLALKPSLAIS